MGKNTLSVCMIVRNESEVIARSLSCAKKFADEIIVADTHSTDDTVKIASEFTDKIYTFGWTDDFAAARNFSLSKATCDYVMWLDADDVITDENCKKIRELVDGGGFDMAYLYYATAFDGDTPTFKYYRERIFKADKNYRFSGFVHEAVAPQGKVVYSNAQIEHRKVKEGDPLRNLLIYQRHISRGETLDARAKFYYGRELMFNKMYTQAAAVLEDFLSGDGWVENRIEACVNLYYCYMTLGKEVRALSSVLRSFTFAPPRPEACCILGAYFFKTADVRAAIYWYERALDSNYTAESGGFVNVDYCAFIPCLQLCVLYDRLGDYSTACAYNERALKIKPNDTNCINNAQYFKNKLNQEV